MKSRLLNIDLLKWKAKNFLRPLIFRRKIHGYCIGPPKTGTTSLSGMFSKNYRSRHEPNKFYSIKVILDFKNGRITQKQMIKYLKMQERGLCLDFNSSFYNIYFLEFLVNEFPGAKFVLTVRDCHSWMDSSYNHLISTNFFGKKKLAEFIIWMLKSNQYKYHKEEANILTQANKLVDYFLPSIDSLLDYWANHYKKAIETVPPEKLLILKTQNLLHDIDRIATFFSISSNSLDPTKHHLFKDNKKYNILSNIDKGFLDDRIDYYCGAIIEKYFSEILLSPEKNTPETPKIN
jgi:hypothetical protein